MLGTLGRILRNWVVSEGELPFYIGNRCAELDSEAEG